MTQFDDPGSKSPRQATKPTSLDMRRVTEALIELNIARKNIFIGIQRADTSPDTVGKNINKAFFQIVNIGGKNAVSPLIKHLTAIFSYYLTKNRTCIFGQLSDFTGFQINGKKLPEFPASIPPVR